MPSNSTSTEKGSHMIQQLIVPIDHSPDSWRAFDVAISLAARSDSGVQLVHVAPGPLDVDQAKTELEVELQRRRPFDVDVSVDVRLSIDTVASELEATLLLHPDAIMVMASHGKGRSAAIIGSVTEDMLQRTFGPIVLVGPNVEPNDFTGPIIVTVDGSQESEAALPLAAAWAAELEATPWIVNVADPTTGTGPSDADVFDTAYLARLTEGLRSFSDHAVQFDELHDRHPDRAVAGYAARHHASLIVASSHGRSGLSRLAMGSVTAGLVRHATCPVVVIRLPHPAHADSRVRMWAY
jgi:nucleotide-binding universal stress UspA family protein